MEKLNMKTQDLNEINIEKLSTLFPELITEIEKDGKLIKTVNVEVLKELVGDYADKNTEVYELSWAGKQKARIASTLPTTNTLRPIKEDSVDFENTENLYIEGDNLEVLKVLKDTYLGKIKMIYIDPPYNTNKDFVYRDKFSMSREEYEEESGIVDEEGNRLIKNTGTDGRFHSNWLNMMYPRLQLAHKLLSDDGIIFISIDDNEVDNLKMLCSELFGENNFIACLPTIMNLKGNNDEFGFSGTHEYTLVFSKNKEKSVIYEFDIDEEEIENWEKDEIGFFKKGATLKRTGINAPRKDRPYLFYPILISKNNNLETITYDEYKLIYDPKNKKFNDAYVEKLKEKYEKMGYYFLLPITEGEKMTWRWSFQKLKNEKNEIIIISSKNDFSLYKKQRPALGELPSKKPKTLFYKPEYSSGNGTSQLKNIFGIKIFDNPKPSKLIEDFVKLSTLKDDIILDFFAGSSTTADAVMQLNTEDGGNRKYIMVQLPEETSEDSEAYKAGYKNICEIGKERIRRAANKIQKDNKDKDLSNVDFGFRVFRLDSSNMKDVYYSPSKSAQYTLNGLESNLKEDRNDKDLLYQVLLEMLIPISANIEEQKINGKTIYNVNNNFMVACFSDNVDLSLVKEIVNLKPLRIVFKDSSFKDDSTKVNCDEYIRNKLPDCIVKVV